MTSQESAPGHGGAIVPTAGSGVRGGGDALGDAFFLSPCHLHGNGWLLEHAPREHELGLNDIQARIKSSLPAAKLTAKHGGPWWRQGAEGLGAQAGRPAGLRGLRGLRDSVGAGSWTPQHGRDQWQQLSSPRATAAGLGGRRSPQGASSSG